MHDKEIFVLIYSSKDSLVIKDISDSKCIFYSCKLDLVQIFSAGILRS